MPDLDHSKLAVLNSLGSPGSRCVYEFAVNQFIAHRSWMDSGTAGIPTYNSDFTNNSVANNIWGNP